ncbi:MAG: hypothetical protein ACRC8S_06980 [Fimbriiglobus sp.]
MIIVTLLTMAVLDIRFLKVHAHNLPRQDEWEFIPAIYGQEAAIEWIWSRHYEHRYPLPRAVYLLLHNISGQDFRAGMVVTFVILLVATATLLCAVRKVRGRSDWVDLLIPALLLHQGHAENLTMGYQIVFSLTIAWLTVALAAVVWRDWWGPKWVLTLTGFSTLGVALGGGTGLVFVPGLVLLHGYLLFQCRNSWGQPWTTWVLLSILPLLSIFYFLAMIIDMKTHGTTAGVNDVQKMREVFFDFWTVSFGGAGQFGYPIPTIVLFLAASEIVFTSLRIYLAKPAHRPMISGCLCLLIGFLLLSVAISVGRPLGGESRYAIFGGFASCVLVLLHASVGNRLKNGFFLFPCIAFGIAYHASNSGQQFCETHDARTAMLARDINRNVPVNFLGERHVLFPIPSYQKNFEWLHHFGHKSLKKAPVAKPTRFQEIATSPGLLMPIDQVPGMPSEWEIRLDTPMKMDYLRIDFESSESSFSSAFRLELPENPDEAAGVVSLWVIPGKRSMLFRVEGTLNRVRIKAVGNSARITVLKCTAVTFESRGD